MSLLTIIQDASALLLQSATTPVSVAKSTDNTTRQMVALANIEGQELSATYKWSVLTRKVVFPAVNSGGGTASNQGLIEDIAPGFLYIIDDTLWLQNQPFKLLGPLSAQQRTALEAYRVQGAAWAYWIEDGSLFLSRPTLPAQNIMFRYQTKNWAKDSGGTTTDSLRNDTDSSILPERCITLGVVWRWLQRNGLPYEQEYMTYQKAVDQYAGRDGTRTVLDASGQSPSYSPQQSIIGGIMVVR